MVPCCTPVAASAIQVMCLYILACCRTFCAIAALVLCSSWAVSRYMPQNVAALVSSCTPVAVSLIPVMCLYRLWSAAGCSALLQLWCYAPAGQFLAICLASQPLPSCRQNHLQACGRLLHSQRPDWHSHCTDLLPLALCCQAGAASD